MKILYFAVNSKHKNFFEKIKKYSRCSGDIVYTQNLILPSLKSLKYITKVDLSIPINLKTKDFIAKIGFGQFRFFIKLGYTFLAYFDYMRYFRAIDSRYTHIMVWNGVLFRQSIAIEIAKLYNISPIMVEVGLMPNRIVVDTKGVNYLNSVPRDREFFENYSDNRPLPTDLIPRNPKNAKKFANTQKIELPKKYIFVPFQVDYDTQILLYSLWIDSMERLFDVVEKLADELDITFVLKEHPSSKKDYPLLHKRAKSNKNLLFANGHTTQELIQNSQAVITINSTVGVESLLFDKRVIVLGEAFFAIDGITKSAKSFNELKSILSSLDSWKFDKALVEKFLKYLYYEYLVEGSFDDYNKAQIEKIEKLIGC